MLRSNNLHRHGFARHAPAAATAALLAAFTLAAFAGREETLGQSTASASGARFAVVISIDGMMPATYTDAEARGLKIPVLRKLMAQGAWSPGVPSVMPAVTYPSHTTMVTGVSPRRHGILTNAVFDPLGTRDGEWYWYENEIRVSTLWQLARANGLRTALISWPVTMGARGDAVMPEFWRGRGVDEAQLVRSISSPGLWENAARRFPDFEAGFDVTPAKDESLADAAVEVIERIRPNLLLLHLPGVDHQQHEHGPWSPEAVAAIELADAQIGRVADAVRNAGLSDTTLFLVVSDHGFARQEKVFRPGVLLRQHGLISVDEKGRVTSWRASLVGSSGSAYVYLHDPSDSDAATTVRDLFGSLAGKSGSGIRRVLSGQQIADLGGDAQALLDIEAEDGFGFAGGASGNLIDSPPTPGIHGFPPDREMMNASLILCGPAVRPGRLEGARLVDVAPTVAHWLGIRMENVEGKALPVITLARAEKHP